MVGKNDGGKGGTRKGDGRGGRTTKKPDGRAPEDRAVAPGRTSGALGGSLAAAKAAGAVRDCMSKGPRTCGPDDGLDRAAQIMWDGDCGCVPVVDAEGHPVGMITDRDACMAAYSTGRRLRDIRVSEAMARTVFHVAPGDSLDRAAALMSEKQVRRLPVVEAGRVVGLLSINDLSRRAGPSQPVDKHEVADVLASVGRPHPRASAAR